jgi:hypothetical protein
LGITTANTASMASGRLCQDSQMNAASAASAQHRAPVDPVETSSCLSKAFQDMDARDLRSGKSRMMQEHGTFTETRSRRCRHRIKVRSRNRHYHRPS